MTSIQKDIPCKLISPEQERKGIQLWEKTGLEEHFWDSLRQEDMTVWRPKPTHRMLPPALWLNWTPFPLKLLVPLALHSTERQTCLLLSLSAVSKSFLSTMLIDLGFCQLTIPDSTVLSLSSTNFLDIHFSLLKNDTSLSVFPSVRVLPSSQLTSGAMWAKIPLLLSSLRIS